MAINGRQGKVFASALLLGAAALAGVWVKLRTALAPASGALPASSPPPQSAPDEPKANPSPPQPAPGKPATRAAPPQPMPGIPKAVVPPPQSTPGKPRTTASPPQPAGPTPRQLTIFASGFVLSAAALVGAWITLESEPSRLPGKTKTSVPALPSVASGPPTLAECPLQPAVAAAGAKDGQFPLQTDVSGMIAADIGSFLVIGKEVAAAGRPRDAEVAFMMSCQVAGKLKGAGSVESADAKYQLGAHYARLALDAGLAADRAELLRRSEPLYADSLQVYRAAYGQAHEKSRFAAEGLAALRQRLAQQEAAPGPLPPAQGTGARTPGPNPSPVPAVSRPQSRKVEVAKADADAPQAPGRAARFTTSFDCSKARSVPEKLICSDAELAQLDRDLGRVYARAKTATHDRAAFRRQQDQEWRMRESICRDRECLLRWYAQRRDQLMIHIEGREQPAPTAAR